MDELHILARAVAERFLVSNNDPVIDTESRLFQDLEQMAITALEPEFATGAGHVSTQMRRV